MDSPFTRQSSLYDSLSRQPGSSSILSSAASSSSRLASPAVSSSVLGRQNVSQSGTPVPGQSKSSLGQTPGMGWPTNEGTDDSTPAASSSSALNSSGLNNSGLNSNALNSNAYSQPGLGSYPSIMGYSYGGAYGGAGGGSSSGSAANQFGSSQQFGSSTPGLNPYGQFGNLGSFGGLYTGSSQFGTPYSGVQYGSTQLGYGSGAQTSQFGAAPSVLAGVSDQTFASDGLAGVVGPSTGTSTAGSSPTNASTAIFSNVQSTQGGTAGAGASNGEAQPDHAAAGGAPGSGIPEFVSPAAIFWNYIDLNSQEQGPFSGMQMHDWIEYLLDSTMLRRHTDQVFIPFAVLKQVLGTETPFIAQLTQQGWDQRMQLANQTTAAVDSATAESAAGKSTAFSDTNADVGQVYESSQTTKKESLASTLANLQMADEEAVDASKSSRDSTPVSRATSTATPVSAAAFSASNASDDSPAASAPSSTGFSHSTAAIAPSTDKRVVAKDGYETRRAEPAEAPSTDPWKKPVRSAQVKISDLKQQALDNQKKKSPESTATRKSAQGKWMPLEQLSVQISSEPGLSSPASPSLPLAPASAASPSTPTWGKKSITPARSLADIQKEQQQQLLAQQSQRSRNSPVISHPVVGGATITTGPLGSKPAQGSKPPVVNSNKGLTTSSQHHASEDVKSGRFSALDPSAQRAQIGTQTAAAPSPAQSKPRVRSQPMSVTARASMASPADELVHWVRVSFKDLVKGVDGMELLEVFLSLGNNKSAREFIADSIYEYSKSLDGRKFASDFLSRKKTAEEAMGAETWKDVLSRFNPNAVVEQDPSFKVVSKKRTQKIARPGDSI